MIADIVRKNTGSRYLCLGCGAVYSSARINTDAVCSADNLCGDMDCPKTDCGGELIEIDELLIPAVWMLNQKGYMTESCCSGHYASNSCRTYIKFEVGIDVPSVPDGFKKERIGGHVIIESFISFGKHDLKGFCQICDSAKILAQWADSLPDIDDTGILQRPYWDRYR